MCVCVGEGNTQIYETLSSSAKYCIENQNGVIWTSSDSRNLTWVFRKGLSFSGDTEAKTEMIKELAARGLEASTSYAERLQWDQQVECAETKEG